MKTKKQYRDFSARFREAMTRAGLDKVTRLEAAENIGVSPPAISYWWNGDRIPTPRTAHKIAEKLSCDAEWLRTGKGLMSTKEKIKQAEKITSSIELLEQIIITAQMLKSQRHKDRRKGGDGDRRGN